MPKSLKKKGFYGTVLLRFAVFLHISLVCMSAVGALIWEARLKLPFSAVPCAMSCEQPALVGRASLDRRFWLEWANG